MRIRLLPTWIRLLGAIGLGSIIGRILAGFVSDKYGVKRILAACLTVKVIVLIALAKATGFLACYFLGFFYGIAYGGFMVVIPTLTSVLFGLRAMGAIFATISIAEGIGFALGSYLAGYIWDVTGSYQMMFRIGIVLILVAFSLTALIRVRDVRASFS